MKFADDTKRFRKIKANGDKQQLQDDIDTLIKWSENGRCHSILTKGMEHRGELWNTGVNYAWNTGVNYAMGGTILCKTVKERELR